MEKEIRCKVLLVEDVSKKTGNPYTRVDIVLENGYKKSVFLNDAEQFVFKSLVK